MVAKRSVHGIVVAVLSGVLVVCAPTPAFAGTTCTKHILSGVGPERTCQYNTSRAGAGNISGTASWIYNNAASFWANTGLLAGVIDPPATNCGYVHVGQYYNGNLLGGLWTKACNGVSKGFRANLGGSDSFMGDGGVRDGGVYTLKFCSTQSLSDCTTIWSQTVGVNG